MFRIPQAAVTGFEERAAPALEPQREFRRPSFRHPRDSMTRAEKVRDTRAMLKGMRPERPPKEPKS
jgi:hypothetical protein